MSDTANLFPMMGVELSEDQLKAIDEAGGWTTSALAQLGASYLEYADAEARYLTAKANLTKHRAAAVQAEMTRGNVVAAIAHELKLPAGEWTYDPEKGKLVKRSS